MTNINSQNLEPCNLSLVTFSIITVTRNNLGGLQRTEAGITAQTTNDYEWIIIDGASNDGTTDYLQTLALPPARSAHFPPPTCGRGDKGGRANLNWLSETDNGIYDAMNKGITLASGTYIIFMNAGDIFAAPDVLEKISLKLNQPYDFVYGDSLETRPVILSTSEGSPAITQEDSSLPTAGQNDKLHYKKSRPHQKFSWGMFTHHQAMLYRREIIGSLRYNTDYKIAADYDFTLRFLQNAKNVLYLPFPICTFESGGISQQNAALGRQEQFQIRKKLLNCPYIKNKLISFKQNMAWKTKQLMPFAYDRIKDKSPWQRPRTTQSNLAAAERARKEA